MVRGPAIELLGRLLEPVADCLTPGAARRLIAIETDATIQARVDDLAERNIEGSLSNEELGEYEFYVRLFDFISTLQARARAVVARQRLLASVT